MAQADTDSKNIFDEFSGDEALQNEIAEAEREKSKDMSYYLWKVGSIFYIINIFVFLSIILLSAYIYIQKNEELYNVSYLDPLCKILIGDVEEIWGSCSSVSALSKNINEKYQAIWSQYYSQVANMLGDVYFISNFVLSKEIMFLLDKSENRLEPLGILSEFDDLKNSFEPVNKAKIQCTDINIQKNGMIDMVCEAYSSRWDRNIIGASGSAKETIKTKWTSISIASSFLNYIEKNAQGFVLVEKPKSFGYEEVIDGSGFTRKTSFDITLIVQDSPIWLLP